MKNFGSYESHHDNDDDDKDSDGSSKKVTRPLFPVARIEAEHEQKKPEPKLNSIQEALAELARKRVELDESTPKEARAENDRQKDRTEGSVPAESKSAVEHAAESVEAKESEEPAEAAPKTKRKTERARKTSETYMPPKYELTELSLNEGEGFINFKTPPEVIDLPTEAAEASEAEELPQEMPAEVPMFQRQPEQQHQAHDEEPVESPEPAERPAVMNTNEVLPAPAPADKAPAFDWLSSLSRPESPVAQADPRPEPAQIYREYMEREAATQQTGPERGVTKEELDDALYYTTKHAQNRGLLTGLLVGGAYEHFKHKRREKKAEKRAKAQDKRLETARRDYTFSIQEQERQRAELNARLSTAERRVTVAENRLTERPLVPSEALQQPAKAPELPVAPAEQLMVPPEHRVETSAWLSTEIDKKTGRVVERPSFQYGHEYYRERAQESAPAQQRNAATGGLALVGATTPINGQQPGDDPMLPPVNLPSASMQGKPANAHSQQGKDDTQHKMSDVALLWPWVLALVVIVICLIVALH